MAGKGYAKRCGRSGRAVEYWECLLPTRCRSSWANEGLLRTRELRLETEPDSAAAVTCQ